MTRSPDGIESAIRPVGGWWNASTGESIISAAELLIRSGATLEATLMAIQSLVAALEGEFGV